MVTWENGKNPLENQIACILGMPRACTCASMGFYVCVCVRMCMCVVGVWGGGREGKGEGSLGSY